MRPNQSVMKAKRGDLVAITRHHAAYVVGQDTHEYEQTTLGIVTRITRDGLVKCYRSPFSREEDDNPREQKLDPTREHCLIVPQSDIDVSAVMAAYKERGWNGTTQIQPFDSVADARAFVQPFRKSCELGQEQGVCIVKDDSTLPRDDDDKLITYAWPGGYPAYYVTEDGGVLCPECARMAEREDLSLVDENGRIDAQWHIVAADINWEDAELYCDHCYTRIESAYAEPES